MARFSGGSSVPGGTYWNPRQSSVVQVRNDGEKLPGTPRDGWVRVNGVAALLAAPVVGGLFVVLLPFIGLGMILRGALRGGTGVARDGARDLAATVAPGWRPGEAHMTGRAMDPKREELPAGGAGEKALADVAAEVARKRAGEPGGDS